ncbi:hypothetical protein Glove_22g195 [Diversispora epigaea]|uniref:SWIM-type domain-containing protein n=1 Tax=Diversispora epigaea TaxID=1348612 RepID=A0A397JLK6_9GLOM|nr:hypothetical protein Glove_22g195 [Diversispora epigaea]
MSPKQRERWTKFYDIIIHDNTARTNKYNYPLSLFILIDNYNKSRLAAQAFMQDERLESYEWLLRCCLEAYEIAPLTFVTDADPAMIAAISTIFPETHHIQCLYHLYQNLPKNLRSCLGSLYQEFLKDFKNIQHSHCESVFERRSQGLVEKYPAGEKYITTMLLNRKYTWVKCFTSRHFTAGTQSTQRVESENALIQKAVQSSFSLSQVQEAIENRLEFEFINNPLTYNDDSFEPFFEKENNNDSGEIPLIPLEADEDRELDLQSLIAIVDNDEIIEIWKVSRYNYPKCYQYIILLNNGEHLCTCFMLITHGIVCRHFLKVFVESSKAQFHLMLIPSRWYKDEYINSDEVYSNEIIISNNNSSYDNNQTTLTFTRKYTINDLSEKQSKQISQRKIKYGILMGETKKAVQYAIQDGDNELIQFIKEYNKRKEAQQIQAEIIKQQESLTNRKINDNQVVSGINGILIDSQQILNPLKHQSKGRPPVKRLKSSYEQSGNKSKNQNERMASSTIADMGRKCGKCGENGHYRSTCSTKT